MKSVLSNLTIQIMVYYEKNNTLRVVVSKSFRYCWRCEFLTFWTIFNSITPCGLGNASPWRFAEETLSWALSWRTVFIWPINTIFSSITNKKPAYAVSTASTLEYKKIKSYSSLLICHSLDDNWSIQYTVGIFNKLTWKVPGIHLVFFAEHDDVLLYLRIQSQTPFTHFENGSVALHCRSVTHGRPRLTPSPSSNRFLFSVVSDDTINKFIFAHESHKEKVNVKYLKHKNMKSICFIHSSIFSARDKTKKYYSEIDIEQ